MANSTKFLRAFALALGLLLTSTVVPVGAQTRADQGQTTDRDHRGFNWGLLGLLGLAGLMNRKRARTIGEHRPI